jgi:two-component system chemotaxis response regulator CheB
VEQHRSADERGLLEGVVSDGMPVRRGGARGPIQRGIIVMAPPDRHLVLERGLYRSVFGPRENLARPSVDVLFRSAAQQFGARVIGVVLSGALSDGTAGLHAIKRAGGLAIVQDPEEAQNPSMPLSALRMVEVDHCLRLAEIAPCLEKLTCERIKVPRKRRTRANASVVPPDVEPEALICPDCGGALREEKSNRMIKFRCHVGHAYALDTLAEAQRGRLEAAIWAARSL